MATRAASVVRGVALVSAAVLAALGVTMLLLDSFPMLQLIHRRLAMLAAFVPHGVLVWPVAIALTLLAGRGRQRLLALLLFLGLALHGISLAPYLPVGPNSGNAPGTSVKVIVANLRFGQADLDQLLRLVTVERPDVVVVTEVTASGASSFQQAQWLGALPYSAGQAGRDWSPASDRGDPTGTMVLARFPMAQLPRPDGVADVKDVAVRLYLPGGSVTLVAAHPVSSTARLDDWRRDAEAVGQLVAAFAGITPLVLAGDLNSTAEQLTVRNAEQQARLSNMTAGQGWLPTYPAGSSMPPLVQIDHVLASEEFVTTAARTARLDGTDHLSLVVSMLLRSRP